MIHRSSPENVPILLVGGGGHCKSCIDAIEQTGKWESDHHNSDGKRKVI